MPSDVNDLREVERLLREAEGKLGPAATFRQRTLLQMILFEVERGLQSQNAEKPVSPPVVSGCDSPDV